MKKISVSILSVENKEDLIKNLVDKNVNVHFDVMDKKFVEPEGVKLQLIKCAKKYNLYADVHLMVEKPVKDKYIKNAIDYGADSITIHFEIKDFEDNLDYLIEQKNKLSLKGRNLEIGVSINPDTSINVLEKYKDRIDKILIMSVNPGYGGQKYIENIDKKILEAKKIFKNVKLQIDGGINNQILQKDVMKNIDDFVIGSYITKNNNLEMIINELYKEINNNGVVCMKKIAIMTAGGDCAGLNSVIKTVVLAAEKKGIVVVGIMDGYIGFVERKYKVLDRSFVTDIETTGGTVLGSSNKECPFAYPSSTEKGKYEDRVKDSVEALKKLGVEGMIIVGGDGTLDSARVIHEAGMPVVGIPKTIDNDMVASNPTIGFETAVENATNAIRTLKSTAYSHRRVMVVEMMGRTSGYLTLHAGFASGADIILLPELDYNLDVVCSKVNEIMNSGKRYVIIAVSEAAKEVGKEETVGRIVKDSYEQKRYGGIAEKLAHQIEEKTGHEARHMVLGHIQRGGAPCTSDIILAARLGNYALTLLTSGRAGLIVGAYENSLIKMEFPKTREARLLDLDNNDVYKTAVDMDISFGV